MRLRQQAQSQGLLRPALPLRPHLHLSPQEPLRLRGVQVTCCEETDCEEEDPGTDLHGGAPACRV